MLRKGSRFHTLLPSNNKGENGAMVTSSWAKEDGLENKMEGLRYKRNNLKGVAYKINQHCQDEILIGIRSVLNGMGNDIFGRFSNSCFGKFFDFNSKIGKSSRAIHDIMSYQIEQRQTQPYRVRSLTFFIKGKVVKFRREEFCLVTGLHFGPSDFDPHQNPINTAPDSMYIRNYGEQQVTMARLNDDFVCKKLQDTEDYVKAAKILFVYYVLLGVPKSGKIEKWVWLLAEDEEAWENFPWGSLSYQFLIYHLDRIKTNRKNEGLTPTYPLCGCIIAFLGWIFTAFPEFGMESGIVSESCIPRMLRYCYKKILPPVMDIICEVLPKLTPTDEEVETLFWQTLEGENEEFSVHFHEYDITVEESSKLVDSSDDDTQGTGQKKKKGRKRRKVGRKDVSKAIEIGESTDEEEREVKMKKGKGRRKEVDEEKKSELSTDMCEMIKKIMRSEEVVNSIADATVERLMRKLGDDAMKERVARSANGDEEGDVKEETQDKVNDSSEDEDLAFVDNYQGQNTPKQVMYKNKTGMKELVKEIRRMRQKVWKVMTKAMK